MAARTIVTAGARIKDSHIMLAGQEERSLEFQP